MNNNIDFSPNKTKKTINYDLFYSEKAILNTNLPESDCNFNRAENLSDFNNSLKADNVRDRITLLIKALEYVY